MKINVLNDILNTRQILPIDENDREINIYNLKNVEAVGESLYYPNVLLHSDNKLYLPVNEKTMSLSKLGGNIYEQRGMTFNLDKTSYLDSVFDPVFFFVYNTDNYYHFLYDSLPYLITFLIIKKQNTNLKLLMNYPNPQKNNYYKFVIEFLEILHINIEDDVLIIKPRVLYTNVYISSSYTHDSKSNLPPRKEIYDFYKEIVNTCMENKCNNNHIFPKKIYISRRSWVHKDFSNIGTNYTTRRQLTNETELVEFLKVKNYKEVFTETMSTRDKIVMFNGANSVVGAIGGGLANLLFSRPETKLIVLVSPTFLDINSRFKYSFVKVNTIYFTHTYHENKDEFKKYMRIKTIRHGNVITGEIIEVYKESVLVSYADSSNIGWNNQNNYECEKFKKYQIEKLDKGLNSPWVCDIEKLSSICNL